MYFKLPPPTGAWNQYQPAVFQPTYNPPPKPPPTFKPLPEPPSFRNPGRELSEVIPEIESFQTKCPEGDLECDCSLYQLIQHLNDAHQWPREKIADWLDELPVDLTFKAKGGDDVTDPDRED
jgi:hypothetical protein